VLLDPRSDRILEGTFGVELLEFRIYTEFMDTEILNIIESDVEKLRCDFIALAGKPLSGNKIKRTDLNSIRNAVISELNMPDIDNSKKETIQRISSALKELSEVFVISFDMSHMDESEIPLGQGATAEEIMAAMEAMPKLSDEAIKAVEKGVRQSKEIPMPDSAWD